MEPKDLTLILTIGISASIGAILGILRSKIFATKIKTTLYYTFYVLAFLLFAFAVYSTFVFWKDSIILIVISFISSIGLAATTFFFLVVKDTFTSEELNPIVNRWTAKADKKEIKLFGGDLDFFGKTPSEMAIHPQYTHLCSMGFRKVLILCASPQNEDIQDSTSMIRYGKILNDLPNSEMRFYNPKQADLNVRGRIIQINGSYRLAIYFKVEKGIFKAIETDTADTTGALYNNIWELTWSLATQPLPGQLESYKKLYQGK